MTLPYRIGIGYDIHRFANGRPLILGGVAIPDAPGLEGHSDADCLTHAISDAVLGAAGLPDIGHYFPPSEARWKGMDSQKILRHCTREAEKHGYRISNIDATIIAEKPKIAPYVVAMRQRLAATAGIEEHQIGIKATTHEGLGDLGRGKGIASHAICLLYRL